MKSSSLAYNRRGTQDKEQFGRDLNRSWCHLHTSVKLLAAAHGAMDISGRIRAHCRLDQELFTLPVCYRRCPWSHGLWTKKIYHKIVWRWHQLLSRSLPNGHLFRVSCGLGRELFTLPLMYWVTYKKKHEWRIVTFHFKKTLWWGLKNRKEIMVDTW